jgi:DNA-binding YbaB/EbfC family protein
MAKGAFRGGSYGGGMAANSIRQAQKLQADMEKLQAELGEKAYSASSGGGAVSVTVNGRQELTSLEIKPEVVDPEELDMLSDLVKAAVNEALRKAASDSEESMRRLTGGLNLGF